MPTQKTPFRATRSGTDIRRASLRNSVNTNIRYSNAYAILDAVIAAGLDVERYFNNGYDPRLLEMITAWRNISNLIAIHQADAVAIETERRSKRKGKH